MRMPLIGKEPPSSWIDSSKSLLIGLNPQFPLVFFLLFLPVSHADAWWLIKFPTLPNCLSKELLSRWNKGDWDVPFSNCIEPKREELVVVISLGELSVLTPSSLMDMRFSIEGSEGTQFLGIFEESIDPSTLCLSFSSLSIRPSILWFNRFLTS